MALPRSTTMSMWKKQVGAIAIKSFALLVVLGTAYRMKCPRWSLARWLT